MNFSFEKVLLTLLCCSILLIGGVIMRYSLADKSENSVAQNDASQSAEGASAAHRSDAISDSEAVRQAVSLFYSEYLAHLDARFSSLENRNDSIASHSEDSAHEPDFLQFLRQSPHVDKKLIEKIERLVSALEENQDFLSYDPVLMAQDIPLAIEYSTPVITENNAELVAYTVWDEAHTRRVPLCIRLVKNENSWRISDIVRVRAV